MKRTRHRRFAFSYDWDREVTTCEPEYYRWNQWFFLRMMERGLAYQTGAGEFVPLCCTVLANEQVVDGCCGATNRRQVEQRALEQWFLRTTAYADELLRDIAQLEGGWPSAFSPRRAQLDRPRSILWLKVTTGARFHTRIDTIYGATCLILAPIVASMLGPEAKAAAKKMIDARAQQGPGDVEKEGFDGCALSTHSAANRCPSG